MKMKVQTKSRKFNAVLSLWSTIALFQLFTSALNAQQINFQDCNNAFPVCELKSYHFEKMGGNGLIQDKLPQIRSIAKSFKETNSTWLKWRTEKSGNLTFIITPYDINDDLDFVVFKKLDQNCESISEIRSLTTGQNIDEEFKTYVKCTGISGLSYDAEDEFDHEGCSENSDNFLKALHVAEGEEFVLFINNFESSKGFSISFEGDAKLKPWDQCISEINNIEITRLYPNPTKDLVTLEYTTLNDDFIEITVSDIKGRKIQIQKLKPEMYLNKTTLETDKLLPGSYIVQIKQSDKVSSKMLIKI